MPEIKITVENSDNSAIPVDDWANNSLKFLRKEVNGIRNRQEYLLTYIGTPEGPSIWPDYYGKEHDAVYYDREVNEFKTIRNNIIMADVALADGELVDFKTTAVKAMNNLSEACDNTIENYAEQADELTDQIVQLKKDLQYQKEQTEYWRREAQDANDKNTFGY